MNLHAKSSFTLPSDEVALVARLKARLRAKSNVDVIRRALRLLDESSTRDVLQRQYREAALAVRDGTLLEVEALDHLSDEGLRE